MGSVRAVVDRVGPTLLHVVHLPEHCPTVADVVIAEPGGRGHLAAGDLVLGVATTDPAEAVELIRHSGQRAAAAVLLKPPLPGRPAIRRAARSTGIGLVEVHAGTSWAQLVWLLRTVLDAIADESETLENGGDPGASDLFRLADAVASVVDAPVTIEDTNSRVLAYSARQDLTDPARVSTIMGRRIPDDVLARFRSRGVFRELSRGRQTIFVPAQQDGTLPRLIVPIRMGGELLGSMWAVVSGPVSDERAAAFADAAPVVALHLLRRRAHADAQRRASAELLRAVLQGKAGPRAALAELDLAEGPHRVVAVDTARGDGRDVTDGEGLRLALLERISHGIGRRPVATELGGLLYAVVPEAGGQGDWPELRAALGSIPEVRAAAGSAGEIDALARSRAEAEEALGLLRAGLVPGPVVTHDDVWTALVLHRAATAAAGADVTALGPLDRLRAHDRTQRTEYVDTLYQWLRHPGDPRRAARTLRIHPNTLRYRMRRLLELTGVNLDDPDVRLALLTQLIALHWR
ncbi:DNA-binding transcriptional regulator, PucR family [Amycolatopsis arida]|uniref:DNA-binding transcriptional regulator, PucR family n=1 Tax=Amycolatopsis arida TaxID=587909 RepID=A0A1I5PFK4_9PSEU|nr:PucR family transcriptional regulator [Amycolatopsis arida]TDX98465.1 DNA-binding PucR family transcriptional regulator [Amycolatopsis arida]SFP32311.1 DNA-binding transcriptional regulator, PucR family [Amycolatopsis arida]